MPIDGIEADGLGASIEQLRALAALLTDLRPFWPRVSRIWIGWVSRTFESEGAFLGEPWEPLSDAYAAWKAHYFPGKPILSMMGDLRRKMTTPERVVGPDFLELIVDQYEHRAITVETSRGTRVIPAHTIEPGWFQEGTEKMPARPLAAEILTVTMEEELQAAGEEYADEIMHRLRLV